MFSCLRSSIRRICDGMGHV